MSSSSSAQSIAAFPNSSSSLSSIPSKNVFFPGHQSIGAEPKSPSDFSSPLLPSPQSNVGHNSAANCPLLGQNGRPKSHFQPSPPPFVISISSPTPLDSLKICGRQQMKGENKLSFGRGKWQRKWILAIGAFVLILATILTNLAFGYWLWARLNKLENAQKAANDLHILELDSLRRHLNWSVILSGQLRKEMESKEAQMKKEMAKLQEKQKVISMAFASSSVFAAALEKMNRAAEESPTTNSTAAPPASKSTSRPIGDFVIFVNGKPINGREFLANPQMHAKKGNGQK